MSSTLGICTCAQCGSPEAWIETNNRQGVFRLDCPQCGYREWTSNLIDKSRTTGDTLHFKYNQAGHLIQRHYTRPGYGVVMLENQATGLFRTLNRPVTPAQIQAILKRIQHMPNLDLERSYFVLWHPETTSPEILFGKFPPPSEAASRIPHEEEEIEVCDELAFLQPDEIPF